MAGTKKSPDKVEAYLLSLPIWSAQICARLRQIILAAHPSITEEWKWGPAYSSNGLVCGWGAFQKHVKLTFYNGAALQDAQQLFNHCTNNEFNRSIKYTQLNEINEPALTAYILEAIAVNEKGFKRVVQNKNVVVPEALQSALVQHPEAARFFESLSYGYRKDFCGHVTEAKTEATRQARIDKIVSLCAAGLTLNSKYKTLKG